MTETTEKGQKNVEASKRQRRRRRRCCSSSGCVVYNYLASFEDELLEDAFRKYSNLSHIQTLFLYLSISLSLYLSISLSLYLSISLYLTYTTYIHIQQLFLLFNLTLPKLT